MRVLVTGGAGFIGGAVVAQLQAGGQDVRVLDALSPAVHRVRPRVDADLRVADLRDIAAVREALRGVDIVSHQAAKVGVGVDMSDAPDYAGSNDLGTAVLLAEMARVGVGRLVLASSVVVYGEGAYTCPAHGPVTPGPRSVSDLDARRFEPLCPTCGGELAPGLVDESARLDPRNVYAASKVAQEHLCAAWARATGGSVVALRYHNVYGPGMPRDTPYAGVAALFRSALERAEAPAVFEDGRQRRDFVHVEDVARANVRALVGAVPAGFRAYNVGSGVPHTIGEMATALAGARGGPAPVVTGRYRLGDVRHITASSALAARELGWSASVPFEAGIAGFATASLRD